MHELPKYPKDHQVGVRVPPGGSNCAKCKFVRNAGLECVQKQFVTWNGSERLPEPANRYCCDFWEERTEKRSASELREKK